MATQEEHVPPSRLDPKAGAEGDSMGLTSYPLFFGGKSDIVL